MTDYAKLPFSKAIATNPFELKDEELKDLTVSLQRNREHEAGNLHPNMASLNQHLELIHHIINSRANERIAMQSLRVAERSLKIAMISAVLSAAAIISAVAVSLL